jgi:hypothetical protein
MILIIFLAKRKNDSHLAAFQADVQHVVSYWMSVILLYQSWCIFITAVLVLSFVILVQICKFNILV